MPLSAAAPAGALLLHIVNDTSSFFSASERYQHLIEYDFIQHFEARPLKTFSKNPGQSAVPLDQVFEPFAAQRTHRSPQFYSTRPARHFRSVVTRLTYTAGL